MALRGPDNTLYRGAGGMGKNRSLITETIK